MSYSIIRPSSHEAWLEERAKGIGSSEAGTIMGVNHFDTPYRLWRRKTGVDGPVEMNEAMELGHYLEESVAQLFASHTGASIVKNSAGDWLAVDDRRPYLRVSPDRIYFKADEPHSRNRQHILECKTSSIQVDKDDIPAYWYCQIQYQMGIMGVKSGALAWLSASPRLHFDWVEVEFNRNFYELLISSIDSFWNDNVLAGIPPEDMTSDDTLLRYPQASDGVTAEADVQTLESYYRLKDISAAMHDLDDEKAEIESRLKAVMGEAGTLVSPAGTVIAMWKNTKESRKFNQKAFLEADPEGYGKYVQTIPGGRRFVIK